MEKEKQTTLKKRQNSYIKEQGSNSRQETANFLIVSFISH